jgi:hypothetical protein
MDRDAYSLTPDLITTEAMIAEKPKKSLTCPLCPVVAWVRWDTDRPSRSAFSGAM